MWWPSSYYCLHSSNTLWLLQHTKPFTWGKESYWTAVAIVSVCGWLSLISMYWSSCKEKDAFTANRFQLKASTCAPQLQQWSPVTPIQYIWPNTMSWKYNTQKHSGIVKHWIKDWDHVYACNFKSTTPESSQSMRENNNRIFPIRFKWRIPGCWDFTRP